MAIRRLTYENASARCRAPLALPSPPIGERMKTSYLEVTFRHGRPLAAYLYLPRLPTDKSHRTARAEPGLVVDFNRRGKPIGIEITARPSCRHRRSIECCVALAVRS